MEQTCICDIMQTLASLREAVESGYSDCLALAAMLKSDFEENPNRPFYGKNVLQYLNPKEPQLSWIIREILAYKEKGKYPVLQSFLNTFFDNNCEVVSPCITAEIGRIDILVRDNSYVLVIESKLKGAGFQKNQLARYISRMKHDYPSKKLLLMVIPDKIKEEFLDSLPVSVWRLPENPDMCKCKCDESKDYLCLRCKSFEKDFKDKTKVLTYKLVEWLNSLTEIIPDREIRLRSLVFILIDYLYILYKIDPNKEYNMDVQKFLKQKLDINGTDLTTKGDDLAKIQSRLADIEELQKHISNLLIAEEEAFIDLCRKKMENYIKDKCADFGCKFDKHHPSNQGWEAAISITYNGVPLWVHVNSRNFGDTKHPRFGIWTENISDEEIKMINNDILKNTYEEWALSRSGENNACLFVPSYYSSVFEGWTELMDAVVKAKNKVS